MWQSSLGKDSCIPRLTTWIHPASLSAHRFHAYEPSPSLFFFHPLVTNHSEIIGGSHTFSFYNLGRLFDHSCVLVRFHHHFASFCVHAHVYGTSYLMRLAISLKLWFSACLSRTKDGRLCQLFLFSSLPFFVLTFFTYVYGTLRVCRFFKCLLITGKAVWSLFTFYCTLCSRSIV